MKEIQEAIEEIKKLQAQDMVIAVSPKSDVYDKLEKQAAINAYQAAIDILTKIKNK